MAKSFSEIEKATIRAKLNGAGLARFTRQAVRAVRIDDLCRDVGIAKGSFYTFYSSKEELFMAIALEREIQHRADMRNFLAQDEGPPEAQAAGFFDMLVEKIKTDPVLNLMIEHGEIEYLLRKIPPDQFAANAKGDRAFIQEMASSWSASGRGSAINADTMEGLMTLMVALMMQVRLMPQPQMSTATSLLRETFVDRLTRNHPPGETGSEEQK